MGVRTTADERLDQIRESIKDLSFDLAKWIYDSEVWGREEYTEEFEDKLQEALGHLTQAKKLIG